MSRQSRDSSIPLHSSTIHQYHMSRQSPEQPRASPTTLQGENMPVQVAKHISGQSRDSKITLYSSKSINSSSLDSLETARYLSIHPQYLCITCPDSLRNSSIPVFTSPIIISSSLDSLRNSSIPLQSSISMDITCPDSLRNSQTHV